MYPYITVLGRQISSYGLCMALGVVLVGVQACLAARKRSIPFEDVLIVSALALGIGLGGGTLLHICVVFTPAQLWQMICAGDFSFVNSGIVFYGALLGGVVGALLGARVAKRPLWQLEDCIVPFVPLGHAIGRVGCVMAGCCNGIAYDGPLALYYPNSVAGLSPDQGYFPTQLLESVLNCLLCLVLLAYRKKERRPYELLFVYGGCYGLVRFLLEFLRGDDIRGFFLGVSTSQWISLGLMAGCLIFCLCRRRRK